MDGTIIIYDDCETNLKYIVYPFRNLSHLHNVYVNVKRYYEGTLLPEHYELIALLYQGSWLFNDECEWTFHELHKSLDIRTIFPVELVTAETKVIATGLLE